jgi:hypothetical protein
MAEQMFMMKSEVVGRSFVLNDYLFQNVVQKKNVKDGASNFKIFVSISTNFINCNLLDDHN